VIWALLHYIVCNGWCWDRA